MVKRKKPPMILTPHPAVAGARASGAAITGIRRNLTGQMFRAARHFAELLRRHQAAHAGKGFGGHWEQSFYLGSAVFILAHSATEAGLNEAASDGKVPDDIMNRFSKGDVLERAGKILKAQKQPRVLRLTRSRGSP
jgi:hypothetical protein